ncbi:zonular occludens toxin domain-containing protein [Massilia pseudoviolaceinigra]|uniref:zonular occludens toxin domain-containing protein n=1 Tax=Massilia pseudoviolaceinigra TaxID=3057165 RepID=UPI0027965881|nr:zonular occludens toxin domain-containing protein [Massilia sp. CCM 9206]MDQ1921573.1 zonular occludens toxin domain-containing protein [Massilia sp. CCM 9206]
MPINVYTGLMGSGKSYEVVSEVILPAVRVGRRVVTNVDGINEAAIVDYLQAKYPDDNPAAYGSILHVENAQVFLPDFFPYYDDGKSAHTDTIVQPGDLVAIDEGWRFWPAAGAKIHKHHQSFFLEHRHFIDPVTKVACDLVLMIQDMGTLNRFIKNVVAFNFRTHKKVSLGMTNTYSVQMWEGHKQVKAALLSTSIRKYKKEIFPLYSSFKGGGSGVIVNADARQNVFASGKLWLFIAGVIFMFGASAYLVSRFFGGAAKSPALPSSGAAASSSGVSAAGAASPAGAASSPGITSPPGGAPFSDVWRVAGSYTARGASWVVLVDPQGRVRLESPSVFQNGGLVQIGEVDGARVSSFTGPAGPVHSSVVPK